PLGGRGGLPAALGVARDGAGRKDVMHERFLSDILAHPEDDAPRLVYADWLEENGQPERAEFIRLQIDLASLPEHDPRRPELRARERALLPGQEAEWGRKLRLAPHQVGLGRGVVEGVYLGLDGLLARAQELFDLAPVREAVVVAGTAEAHLLDSLARQPFLGRLTSLGLSYSALGPEEVRALARSPYLGGLRSLSLDGDAAL